MTENKPCSNCEETQDPCACMRNHCLWCGKPVGNITFTCCDDCFNEIEIDLDGNAMPPQKYHRDGTRRKGVNDG